MGSKKSVGEERRGSAGARHDTNGAGPSLRSLGLGLGLYAGWRLARGLWAPRIEGNVVLVTGGSRGLGLALAREFAEHECRVAICARDRRELAAARDDLEARGADVLSVRGDVTDPRQAERIVRRVVRRYGALDLLVNNAGLIQVGPLAEMTLHDFQEAMAANFWGAVNTTLAALPGMLERGDGRIVNITSIGGKVAVPRLLPYDCAKFALVGFSQGLRAELAGRGVSVTTVVPGLMRTGSPVNARFKGRASLEYSWFSAASATPLTTTSAERAARRIVQAARWREAELTLTWQAKLLRLTHDLFPGPVADLLGLLNRAVSRGAVTGGGRAVPGMKLHTRLSPSAITGPMNRAALELNQYGGSARPSRAHAERVGLDGGDSGGR